MMRTGTHACLCGETFGLRVELAMHREKTGHAAAPAILLPPPPVVVDVAVVEEVLVVTEAPPAPRRRPRIPAKLVKPLLVAGLLASFLGLDLVMEATVWTYNALQPTLAAHVVCP